CAGTGTGAMDYW
nr:immunoglobulin heavy chain junction region [Mus musculus]MBK4196330.1 immunoglobulin heavy chain junction region [Mus musculus]